MDYVCCFFFFFFNDTATTEIYTLSLHDALPIFLQPWSPVHRMWVPLTGDDRPPEATRWTNPVDDRRSEEHTSELQSRPHISYAVFCLKKKIKPYSIDTTTILYLLLHQIIS